MGERKTTGLKDLDEKEIFFGDIVEFYFCADKGHSKEPDKAYSRMRDIVEEHNGSAHFVCGVGSAPASEHVDYCRVIGRDPALIDT